MQASKWMLHTGGGWGETPPPTHMIVKRFGCTAIHNKALYKCIIHSSITIYREAAEFQRNYTTELTSITYFIFSKQIMDCNFLLWKISVYLCIREKADLCLVMHRLCKLLASTAEDTQLSLHIRLIICFLSFFPQSVHRSWRSSVFTQSSWLFHTHLSGLLWGRCRFKRLCLRVTSMSHSSNPSTLMGHRG